MKNYIEKLLIVGLFISVFIMGWAFNDLYSVYNYERELNGFYSRNNTLERVNNYAEKKDPFGDWVCVNIRGMTFEDALKTCSHETGHEIFAEFCEDNIDKCIEVTNE